MKGGKHQISILFVFVHIFNLGPFRFMDTYGISNIVDIMKNYQIKYGDRFAPTQLLIDMAKENKKFYL
jgi:3-hydroxyacyl-CoA dehydrogenase/enoyl-CoA hydratase/3-hydroxybutyryl-CoA epimerase